MEVEDDDEHIGGRIRPRDHKVDESAEKRRKGNQVHRDQDHDMGSLQSKDRGFNRLCSETDTRHEVKKLGRKVSGERKDRVMKVVDAGEVDSGNTAGNDTKIDNTGPVV